MGWVGVGWGGKHVVIMLASPAELGLGLSLAIFLLNSLRFSNKAFFLFGSEIPGVRETIT